MKIDLFNKDKLPGPVKITKFPSEKKPYQKNMADLIKELKDKPKTSKYYDGDQPPWD